MASYRALIVEDTDIAQKMTAMALESCGFEVTVCESGMGAVDIYETQNFDLVLVDVGLPDTDGFTIAETLREYDRMKNKILKTLIVAVTVHADQQYRELAVQAGFDEYFVKPFSPDMAKKLVARLRKKKSEDGKVIELFS